MKFTIQDFSEKDLWYFPLQFELMKELACVYDHEVAFMALLFACNWLLDNNHQIDIQSVAKVIADKQKREYLEVETELEIAFKRIVRTILPLAKKMELSRQRSEAGKRGMAARWKDGL